MNDSSADSAPDLDHLRDELIFKAGYIAENIGLNKSMGQLYAALYITGDSICLDDLAEISRMSKGNASINLRRLEDWDAVRRVRGEGSRKDYYVANRDIFGFVYRHLTRNANKLMSEGGEMLSDVRERMEDLGEMDEESRTQVEKYTSSLDEIDALMKKVKLLIGNMNLFSGLMKGIS